VIFGCKKHPFDYRNKFLGNYKFNVHAEEWSGVKTWDTTYTYNGRIYYDSRKNTIRILYAEKYSLKPVLKEDGTLYIYSEYCSYGKFESNSNIRFRVEWEESFGNHYIHEVAGDRIK